LTTSGDRPIGSRWPERVRDASPFAARLPRRRMRPPGARPGLESQVGI